MGRGLMLTKIERGLQQRFRVYQSVGRVRTRYSRRALPRLFTQDLGYRKGAEIGVWRGAYSAAFCQADPALHMLCVDPWEPHRDWLDTKNTLPEPEARIFIEEAYGHARAKLAGLNATIARKFSAEAAAEVPDGSLDFVYIDANHVYDAVTADLEAWVPKVRPGGIVSGHDYRVFKNKPMIHVVEAVNAYTKRHQISPWYVLAGDPTPSFLWVKH